jgi:endogenous inhibitor of DNA gyrase (YacG/DUF329 family)
MPGSVRYVNCPRCGIAVAWHPDNPFRPFCSERCKTVDLGAWATERYRVAAVENGQDADDDGEPREPREPQQ